MTSSSRGGFDVALALRRVVLGFWLDFAPIVLLGFGMLTLPRILGAAVAPLSSAATIVAVVAGLLAALFVTIVSFGVVERLRGRPLDAAAFVRRGLVASPPGLSVALLIGAGLVVAGIAALLGTPWRIVPVVWGVAAFGILLVLPAVPAAVVERLGPLPALHRAFELSRRSLGRVLVVAAVVTLALVPCWLLVDAVATGTPGLWLRALFELVGLGIVAVIPGVVYTGLVEVERRP